MIKIPKSIADVLLHVKTSDLTERVIMPVTRYDNVLCAPRVVTEEIEREEAPYNHIQVNTEELSEEEIRKICEKIIKKGVIFYG